MIATISLILFMLIIPASFKKIAVKYIVEKKKQGVAIFLLSKLLWWTAFLLLANIWVPIKYFAYIWALAALGIGMKIFMDRKYVFLKFEKNLLKNP